MTRYCKCFDYACHYGLCAKTLRVSDLEMLDEATGERIFSVYCEHGTGFAKGNVREKDIVFTDSRGQLMGRTKASANPHANNPLVRETPPNYGNNETASPLANKIDRLAAELPIAIGTLRAEVQSEGKKTRSAIKRSQGSNRERFSEATQEAAHKIWESYRKNKDIAPSNRGRKLTYEDVFNYAKRELAALSEPIITADAFRRCLGARSDRIGRNTSKKPQT